MNNDYFQYYHPKLLIPLLVFLGIAFYLGNELFNSHWGVSVSIISVITSMLLLIDKYLWRYRPFSFLFWSINLEGRYEGVIEYSDPITQKQTKKKTAVEISQSGSSIKLKSYFGNGYKNEQTISKSIHTNLVKDEHGEYCLVFTYQNDGNTKLGFSPHFGTNIFRVIKSKGKVTALKGEYYTNRLPVQTKGTIRVDYKSKELSQE